MTLSGWTLDALARDHLAKAGTSDTAVSSNSTPMTAAKMKGLGK